MNNPRHPTFGGGRFLLFLIGFLWWASISAFAAEQVYIVKPRDTLSGIARKHGLSVSDLAQRNDLKDSNRLMAGQKLIIPTAQPSYTERVVRRGDSLAAIAKETGVPVERLAQYNRLANPNQLSVGQVILIPHGSQANLPALDPDLRRILDSLRVSSKRWKYIVVHHSASNVDTPQSMDAYHRSRRMENGLAYHFVIGNGRRTKDGDVFVGNRWRKQLDGGHLASASLNRQAVGICLVGDFDKRVPTRKQMEALTALCRYLMQRCDIQKSRIRTHQQINTRPTQCPGKRFPTQRFLNELPS